MAADGRRIYEIAKDAGASPKDAMEAARSLGIHVVSASTKVSGAEARLLREALDSRMEAREELESGGEPVLTEDQLRQEVAVAYRSRNAWRDALVAVMELHAMSGTCKVCGQQAPCPTWRALEAASPRIALELEKRLAGLRLLPGNSGLSDSLETSNSLP